MDQAGIELSVTGLIITCQGNIWSKYPLMFVRYLLKGLFADAEEESVFYGNGIGIPG